MKPILSIYLFDFQQEGQRMVNNGVKEGRNETESDFLWIDAVMSVSTAIYYCKLDSAVTRKTEKHKDGISCHLLNSTKNKIWFACIRKPQRPLLKVSLSFSGTTCAGWSEFQLCLQYACSISVMRDATTRRGHRCHPYTPASPVTTKICTWGAVMIDSALFYVKAKTGKRKSLPHPFFPSFIFLFLPCLENSLACRCSITTNFFLLISITGIVSVSITNG